MVASLRHLLLWCRHYAPNLADEPVAIALPILAFVDFLEKIEAWVPDSVGRIYAIVDNLRAQRAYDVLLFNAAHPRREFVFLPKYAAYLNLIEPWWKILKSPTIKGRFFETHEQIEETISRRRQVLERFARGVGCLSSSPLWLGPAHVLGQKS